MQTPSPAERFAHLPEAEREQALKEYNQQFQRAQRDIDRRLLWKSVEQMLTIDVLLIRAAFIQGDTAEVGRIMAHAMSGVLCADAAAHALAQRALQAAA